MAKEKNGGKKSAPAADATANVFTLGDKTYKVLIPRMIIPGDEFGTYTAADVCADVKAQEYLVKVQSSAIREIEA